MKKSLIALLILIVIIAGYFLAPAFIGKAPQKKFTEKFTEVKKTESAGDAGAKTENPHVLDTGEAFPELNRLREETTKDPTNIQLLTELAENLKVKVIVTRNKQLIFELIDTLTKILENDPNNKFALLEMANITFESKVFSKAKKYYELYLAEEPADVQVRSRYASSLIFLKETDQAITELNQIIKEDAEYFPAYTYLAIAYAENGDKEKALEIGEIALKKAPEEEVKERFAKYLESIRSGKAQPQEAEVEAENSSKGHLVPYLATNEVTASKFVSLSQNDSSLQIYFQDFPVAQMPDFAKEKFFGNLRDSLNKDLKEKIYKNVSKIVLLDNQSGEILAELEVK